MKVIRFFLVGIANTSVGFSIILFFSDVVGFNAFLSNFLGYCFGYLLSYFTHKLFTFRSSGFSTAKIYKYFFACALSYSLNLFALHLCLSQLQMIERFAQLFAMVVYSVSLYTLLNKWVFVEKTS